MLAHYLLNYYVFPYFIIGVIITIIIDVTIYFTKSSDRLTFAEIWGSILIWPLVLYVFLKGFFNQD